MLRIASRRRGRISRVCFHLDTFCKSYNTKRWKYLYEQCMNKILAMAQSVSMVFHRQLEPEHGTNKQTTSAAILCLENIWLNSFAYLINFPQKDNKQLMGSNGRNFFVCVQPKMLIFPSTNLTHLHWEQTNRMKMLRLRVGSFAIPWENLINCSMLLGDLDGLR